MDTDALISTLWVHSFKKVQGQINVLTSGPHFPIFLAVYYERLRQSPCCNLSVAGYTSLGGRKSLDFKKKPELYSLLYHSLDLWALANKYISLSLRIFSFWSLQNCCSVAKSCPTLRDPMDCNMPSFPVLHYLLELAQTHVHWVSDVIQPSHPQLPSSPLALNLSLNQGLFQWVNSSH